MTALVFTSVFRVPGQSSHSTMLFLLVRCFNGSIYKSLLEADMSSSYLQTRLSHVANLLAIAPFPEERPWRDSSVEHTQRFRPALCGSCLPDLGDLVFCSRNTTIFHKYGFLLPKGPQPNDQRGKFHVARAAEGSESSREELLHWQPADTLGIYGLV